MMYGSVADVGGKGNCGFRLCSTLLRLLSFSLYRPLVAVKNFSKSLKRFLTAPRLAGVCSEKQEVQLWHVSSSRNYLTRSWGPYSRSITFWVPVSWKALTRVRWSLEFQRRDMPFSRQQVYPLYYKGELAGAYIADLVVARQNHSGTQVCPQLTACMEAQLINYLRLSKFRRSVPHQLPQHQGGLAQVHCHRGVRLPFFWSAGTEDTMTKD